MKARLHLLPWDRPLLGQAVAWLAADWVGAGPLDLSHLLVVVPTRQSGRRLREALAAHAGARGQAVFSPRVVLPETLATLSASPVGVATRLASQLAWIRVLRRVPLVEFRAVFPVDPPVRDFAWARRLADQLLHLQSTLAEVGLQIGGVASQAGPDFPEAERWQQLADLEQRYVAVLAGQQLRDAQAAKLDFALQPILTPGIKKIIMLGTPDPLPLASRIIALLAEQLPVEIGVFGPADESVTALFDEWGRPRVEVWTQRELGGADFEQRVRLCLDPVAQAGQLVALAQRYVISDGGLALGIADAEILAPLAHGLSCAGLSAFNPEGRLRRQDGLYALLSLLAEFARSDAFATSAALLRCPALLDWLAAQSGAGFSSATLLREWDALQAEHLPPTLAAARSYVKKSSLAAEALAKLAGLQLELQQGVFPQNCLQLLEKLFAVRAVQPAEPLVASAAAWVELAGEVDGALKIFPDLTPAESWEFALAQFAESVGFTEKLAGALELNGWLELLWEDAPHLVVAGLNDGRVPDVITGDAFLPEVLRERLGLKTNGRRFARDAYLLAALGAARATAGRLEILLGKVSLAGDPLRPSRLLLRCADADLPARIEFLFDKVVATQASLPWTRAWPLQPTVAPPLKKISVTAFRDYLQCPFRFYLRRVRRMAALDLEKAELDARDFGNLMHEALRVWGDDEKLRTCGEESVLREALLSTLEGKIRAHYGRELTLPLVIQFESARQRLRQAAAVQAAEFAAGWRIEAVEQPFNLSMSGLMVGGKIDRLDRHIDGRVRVLDYKTSDTPVTPAQAHWGPVNATSPEWARLSINGKERAWLDLQLPLYRLNLAPAFGPAVACGYFNLPKGVGATAISVWTDYTPDVQRSAEACARHIVAAVAAGEYWPPAELKAGADRDWGKLFHQGTAASVAADALAGGAR
jgi:ATP-dependent helicase/nuclease subunit B